MKHFGFMEKKIKTGSHLKLKTILINSFTPGFLSTEHTNNSLKDLLSSKNLVILVLYFTLQKKKISKRKQYLGYGKFPSEDEEKKSRSNRYKLKKAIYRL